MAQKTTLTVTEILTEGNGLSTEPDLQRFTATGRPMPAYKHDFLTPASTEFNGTSNLLPVRFTDDSIISVPVPRSKLEVPPPYAASSSPPESYLGPPVASRRKSWAERFGRKSSGDGKEGAGKGKKEEFVVVKMTRGEYLKYWARDEEGRYVGTEPEEEGRRIWGERLGMEKSGRN